MSKKICIIGDSWGCGEWGWKDGKYQCLHKGIEYYLKNDNYQVMNFSFGGASNLELFTHIQNKNLIDYDLILYIQTDPLRDYRKIEFQGLFESIKTFKHYQRTARHNHYNRLNSLDIKIHLIGGCDKIDENDLIEYKNLKCFIPSIINFVSENLIHPNIWASDWINYIDRKCSAELLNFIHQEKMLQDELYFSKNPVIVKYFHPDGQHPNRNAYYKIYKKIIEELLT